MMQLGNKTLNLLRQLLAEERGRTSAAYEKASIFGDEKGEEYYQERLALINNAYDVLSEKLSDHPVDQANNLCDRPSCQSRYSCECHGKLTCPQAPGY